MNINDLGSYESLLQHFQRKDYQFVFFPELNNPEGQVLLRHDIDFDTGFALEAARIEAQLGIKSTYFFLLRSNFYNIFSPRNHDNILKIKELGHSISIHFDPLIYDDFDTGLQVEIDFFQRQFDTEVRIISLHRPNPFFQEYDAPIRGVEHTYQSKYFKHIKYFSDSTGQWRFGHPVDSPEYAEKKSLHILINPVWWMMNGPSNLKKLQDYYARRAQELKTDFFDNCVPFREIYDYV
jgi:hypothetical protein